MIHREKVFKEEKLEEYVNSLHKKDQKIISVDRDKFKSMEIRKIEEFLQNIFVDSLRGSQIEIFSQSKTSLTRKELYNIFQGLEKEVQHENPESKEKPKSTNNTDAAGSSPGFVIPGQSTITSDRDILDTEKSPLQQSSSDQILSATKVDSSVQTAKLKAILGIKTPAAKDTIENKPTTVRPLTQDLRNWRETLDSRRPIKIKEGDHPAPYPKYKAPSFERMLEMQREINSRFIKK